LSPGGLAQARGESLQIVLPFVLLVDLREPRELLVHGIAVHVGMVRQRRRRRDPRVELRRILEGHAFPHLYYDLRRRPSARLT
jgi:hypothetical protein